LHTRNITTPQHNCRRRIRAGTNRIQIERIRRRVKGRHWNSNHSRLSQTAPRITRIAPVFRIVAQTRQTRKGQFKGQWQLIIFRHEIYESWLCLILGKCDIFLAINRTIRISIAAQQRVETKYGIHKATNLQAICFILNLCRNNIVHVVIHLSPLSRNSHVLQLKQEQY
jgi:hypothetical protein